MKQEQRIRRSTTTWPLLAAAALLAALLPTTAAAQLSDDFNGCGLNEGLWTFVDPLSDATAQVTGAGSGDAHLEIEVPSGTNHEAGYINDSPRLMQPVADTDFTIDASFVSAPALSYQMQGLIVEETPDHFLRFEMYSDGTSTRAIAVIVENGGGGAVDVLPIDDGVPVTLRVERAGDTFTFSYSYDGSAFAPISSFDHPMTVSAAGPHAGNFSGYGAAPPYTAIVDYFFDASSPIANEDAGSVPTDLTLNVDATPGGSVDVTPSQTTYACGDYVTLSGTPEPTYSFDGWSGDVTGSDNPARLQFTQQSSSVQAAFSVAAAPVISDIDVTPGADSAVVSWTTDLPTDSRVDFGTTTAYELGVVGSSNLETQHNLVLNGLAPGTLYHFMVTSETAEGGSSASPDQSFVSSFYLPGSDPSGLVSSDFNQCALDTSLWSFVDPLGDSSATLVGGGSGESAVHISVPGGPSHDADGANFSARLLQPVNDGDIEIVASFQSVVTTPFQEQGVVVYDSLTNDYLRFEMYSSNTGTNAYAARIIGGNLSTQANVSVGAITPGFIRVHRTGDEWRASYSFDGDVWVEFAVFTWAMTMTDVGPYAGNYSPGSNAPAHTAIVDYFFSSQSPVVPEDDGSLPVENILDVSVIGSGGVTIDPDQSLYSCNELVTLTATPAAGHTFTGWSGDLSGSVNPESVQMSGNQTLTASFSEITGSIGNISVTPSDSGAVIAWTTTDATTSIVDYGETALYELGQVSDGALVTNHSIELAGLAPSTQHHYRVLSEYPGGGSLVSADLTFTTLAPPPPPFASDDFNTCTLDGGLWTFVDPLGDATALVSGAGSGDAVLAISVPAGQEHEPWTSNTAARVMQTATDGDFELEVKLESLVTQPYQEQGVLIQGDSPDHFLRFDFYSDGTDTRVFAADIEGWSPTIHSNVVVPTVQPLYMRIARQGDTWTQSYSTDGGAWTQVSSFDHSIAVVEAGVFAGNAKSGGVTPAHTAVFDYVSLTNAPVVDEDLAAVPSTVTLSLANPSNGSIDAEPDQASYTCGEAVELTATPLAGFAFASWGGDLSGGTNPRTITPVRDLVIDASFVVDTTPPVVSNVYVVPGHDAAIVGWTTSEPATSRVDFGSTTGYELGGNEDLTLETSHSVLLEGLSASSLYHFQISSQDLTGNLSVQPDATFTTGLPPGAHASGLYSDDFNKCVVDTSIWSVVDPLGDSSVTITGAGAGDAKLEIALPAGQEHPPTAGNLTARLMQDVNDTDFTIEVKFDSIPTEAYQEQGVIVETSSQTFLRFDFFGDGGGTSLLAASYLNGAMNLIELVPLAPSQHLYMRIDRSGDIWTASHSFDGASWTTLATFSFPMTVGRVGVFAGNESFQGTTPAHTAVIDTFSLTESPVVPEDFGSVAGSKSLTVSTAGPGSVDVDPDQPSYGCGETVTLTAIPDLGFAFDGWSQDLGGSSNPVNLVLTDDRNVTASFILDTVPPIISDVEVFRGPSTALVIWSTNEPATSEVAYGETTAYELGTEISAAFTKNHSALISGLDSATTYHLQITSVDGASLFTTTPDIVSGPAQGPVIDVFLGTNQSFGHAGLAQPWANILGNASDPDGVASLTYSLNGGPEIPLEMGWDSFRLDSFGDFNADIPTSSLQEGANTVAIRSADTLGNQSLVLVNLDFTSGFVTSLPYAIDWSAENAIQDVAQVVDGRWVIQNGALHNLEMGYDRLVAIGDVSWTDYEATVTLTVDQIELYFESPSNGPAVGLITRWPGHVTDGEQPARRWWPLGAYGHHRWSQKADLSISERALLEGDKALVLDSEGSDVLTPGLEYVLKMRVETLPDGSVQHSFKKWLSTDPEPGAWMMQGSEAPGTEVASGSLLIVAHHVQVSVSSVSVVPLP